MQIDIKSIRIEQRSVALHRPSVERIKTSLIGVGQIVAITVVRDGDGYILVDGRHRLEAGIAAGHATIEAYVIDLHGQYFADERRKLMEHEANIIRHDLTVEEKAIETAKAKALYDIIHETPSKEERAKAHGLKGAALKKGEPVPAEAEVVLAKVPFEQALAEKTGQPVEAIKKSVADGKAIQAGQPTKNKKDVARRKAATQGSGDVAQPLPPEAEARLSKIADELHRALENPPSEFSPEFIAARAKQDKPAAPLLGPGLAKNPKQARAKAREHLACLANLPPSRENLAYLGVLSRGVQASGEGPAIRSLDRLHTVMEEALRRVAATAKPEGGK